MKKTSKIPFSHSLKELENIDEKSARFVKIESDASNIYNLCLSVKRGKGSEYRHKVVRG